MERGSMVREPRQGKAGVVLVADRRRKRSPLSPKASAAGSVELTWLEAQVELRRQLAGEWVAIKGERLLAHGLRLKDVLQEAKARGETHPFVTCLPEIDDEELALIA